MSKVPLKKVKIEEAGKELFWKFGIKRVTVEEICEKAEVSKMTFYKYYSNKIDFAETLLDTVLRSSLNNFRELTKSDKSFQEKIQGMFIIKNEAIKNISPVFINDLYKNQEYGLHLKMEELGKISMKIFYDFLESSKKEKLIRKEVSIDFIINYMNSVSVMIENTDILKDFDSVEEFVMEAMNFMFYGIMNIEKSN